MPATPPPTLGEYLKDYPFKEMERMAESARERILNGGPAPSRKEGIKIQTSIPWNPDPVDVVLPPEISFERYVDWTEYNMGYWEKPEVAQAELEALLPEPAPMINPGVPEMTEAETLVQWAFNAALVPIWNPVDVGCAEVFEVSNRGIYSSEVFGVFSTYAKAKAYALAECVDDDKYHSVYIQHRILDQPDYEPEPICVFKGRYG